MKSIGARVTLAAMKQAGKSPVVLSTQENDELEDQFIRDNPQMDGIVAIDDYSGLQMYLPFQND